MTKQAQQHTTLQSTYGTELHAAMELATPAERRAACDAAHARYEAACEAAGIEPSLPSIEPAPAKASMIVLPLMRTTPRAERRAAIRAANQQLRQLRDRALRDGTQLASVVRLLRRVRGRHRAFFVRQLERQQQIAAGKLYPTAADCIVA
jgi:hypothetical protein